VVVLLLVVVEEEEEEGEDGGEAAAVPSTTKRILLCKLSPSLSSTHRKLRERNAWEYKKRSALQRKKQNCSRN
jgi:hypothetical protein